MTSSNAPDRDFAIGLALGYQWADMVNDDATKERFVDAAVMHGLPDARLGDDSQEHAAIRLAAAIIGVRCDDDAATAFWSMVAPGIDLGELSHWFFEGFIYGAAESFSASPNDEYAELRKLVPHPSARA